MRDKKVYEEKFGSWWPKIAQIWEDGTLDIITDYLQERSQKGHKIVPESNLTYRIFQEVPIDKVKVFIFGLCPYHSSVEKTTIADGLALSCSRTGICQPSLEQFYNGIENELNEGLCLKCFRNPDLSYLAKQGVFLGNVALTTELHKVHRHADIWEKFTEFFIDKVVGTDFSDVPVIFLGKEASKFYPFLAPFQWEFQLSHPASASYTGDVWDSEGVFGKINQILRDQKKEEIEWIKDMI